MGSIVTRLYKMLKRMAQKSDKNNLYTVILRMNKRIWYNTKKERIRQTNILFNNIFSYVCIYINLYDFSIPIIYKTEI